MLVETYMRVACEINSAMVSLELLKEDAFGGIIKALLFGGTSLILSLLSLLSLLFCSPDGCVRNGSG